MSLIGIIANPSSGKDIRRLVAEAAGMDNRQKVNIVRRVLLGIAAVGVDEVALMPDTFGIGPQALDSLELPFHAEMLHMPVTGSQCDSQHAAALLRQRAAACVVVLGGDGTHRVVAKGCGDVPLVALATGTNNVWPRQDEATLAGLAAALVARAAVPLQRAVERTRRLEVQCNGTVSDIALVDVASYDGSFTGSRAIWDPRRIKELLLATVSPGAMGLSSIGSAFADRPSAAHTGLLLRIGSGGRTVLAAIAPGMMRHVPIEHHRWLSPGDTVLLSHLPCVLALDGEREIVVSGSDHIEVRLTGGGPLRVDVPSTLQAAAEAGWLVQGGVR